MSRYLPCIENLEQRRLMDADGTTRNLLEQSTPEVTAMTSQSADRRHALDPHDEAESGTAAVGSTYGNFLTECYVAFPPTQVFRSGSTVVAIGDVNYSGLQKLSVIREGGDNGGEIAYETELGRLRIEKVLIDGNHLLVIADRYENVLVDGAVVSSSDGSLAFPQKQIFAVDLSTGGIAKSFELPPSSVKYADFSNGQATIIAQRNDLVVPQIWPPVETNDDVYRFTWKNDGLSELQKGQIPSGQVTVDGDRVFVAVKTFNREPIDLNEGLGWRFQTELRMFALTNQGVESLGSVNVGVGNVAGVQVNQAADQVAVALSSDGRPVEADSTPWSAEVLIVEFTDGAAPVIKESIAIPQALPTVDETSKEEDDPSRPLLWYQPLDLVWQDQDHFVFSRAGEKALVVVDLGDDVAGEDRLQTIELPEKVRLGHGAIRLDDDRFVFVTGDSDWATPFLLPPREQPTSPEARLTGNGLLTVSLSQGTATLESFDGPTWINDLRVIDASKGRIGFLSNAQSGLDCKFMVGTMDTEGNFVVEEAFTSDSEATTFHPFESLITITDEVGLKTYSYDQPDEPLYAILWGDDSRPELKAENDMVKLYWRTETPAREIHSEWIDLLANDQIRYRAYGRTRIIELMGAPEGVRLIGGRFVSLDSRVELFDQPLVFKYKVSDGLTESVAEVELTLAEVSEEQRAAMVEAVKAAASTKSGLSTSKLTVEVVTSLNEESDPRFEFVHNVSPMLYFTFRVTGPGFKAFYGSDLAANVNLIAVPDRQEDQSPREPVVELSLVATGDDGRAIQSIEAGDSFWLELRGKDLRTGAQGIFSTFLNLTVPGSLSFEGTVEPGEGFSFINASGVADKVTDQSITSLGVIDTDGAISTSTGDTPQVLLRVRVTANNVGAVTLVAGPSRSVSEETTVLGLNDALQERQIKRMPLALVIGEPEPTSQPTDVDGDGTIRPVDALRVINMISRHGVGTIAEIESRMAAANGEAASKTAATNDIRRFDVNRNGSVTPLDALLVINHISRENRRNAASGESPQTTNDTETLSADPTLETPEQKRKRR